MGTPPYRCGPAPGRPTCIFQYLPRRAEMPLPDSLGLAIAVYHEQRTKVNLMTYAVAVALQRGVVFAADTRTIAGIDNASQFRKLHFGRRIGDRVQDRKSTRLNSSH